MSAARLPRILSGLGGLVAGFVGASGVAHAVIDEELHPPNYPWDHHGYFEAFDHASLRRGWLVYQQVCAACHTLYLIHWRDLIGHIMTESEAKATAAEYEYIDGPDDQGNQFARPGRIADYLPEPYKNEQAARYANGGALPPDLSLITGARHNGTNYVFALLTGYREPPAGIKLRDGLYYNPYFPGGAIAMPKMLTDDGVEYEDGTKAWASQQAKDVVTFLDWCMYPYQDERKLTGWKMMTLISILLCLSVYHKRLIWAPVKSQKVVMDVVN